MYYFINYNKSNHIVLSVNYIQVCGTKLIVTTNYLYFDKMKYD